MRFQLRVILIFQMMRLVVIDLLLLSSGVTCMIVRRQTNPDCPFELLPVLNVCPPCQPSGCHCVDGKELTLDDQRVAEEVSSYFLMLLFDVAKNDLIYQITFMRHDLRR